MRLLSSLESFVQLAKARNFGRAANLLGITAPTLSRRIQSLESELDCVLIQRSTRSFALTDQGLRLLLRAEQLMEEAAQVRSELSCDSSRISGHLRVGVPFDLAASVLGPILASFCREQDAVTLDIVAVQGQPELSRDLLDVAFVVVHQRPLPDSSHALHRVGAFPRMLYASKPYLSRKSLPGSPPELANHLCIRHLEATPESYWVLRNGAKRSTVAVQGTCNATSLINASQAAREHLGIVMLPKHLACSPALGTKLTRVLPDWEGPPALIFALTAQRRLPAKMAAVIEMVRSQFTKRLAALDAAGGW